jgi:regulator of sirC expression with transglutaminase-like and TPR domain
MFPPIESPTTMLKQRNAIIQLLRDNDPETVRLVKEQLAHGGGFSVPDLKELLTVDDELVTGHVREVLGEIQTRRSIADFSHLCRCFSEEADLEEACWMIARVYLPGIETALYRAKLDAWGRDACRLLGGAVSARDRVGILSHFISQRLGFKGNVDDYYHLKNSLLPSVIDSRQGIPITLSLLYVLIARRAGMVIDGINLPGHFILRHQDLFFDPFHSGRFLTTADCAEILARQQLVLVERHLLPADKRTILMRIVANLLHVAHNGSDTNLQDQLTLWLEYLKPAA